ncbi:hypothetical protein P7F88_07765 [Vibrio hannami]|nr:hypothetical protein [Vibrio hannami]MDG3085998.1 hypothetical protein [Vibrio hannami]
MSSILASQVEVAENKSNLKEALSELAATFTMFSVTAAIILVLSLQWAV